MSWWFHKMQYNASLKGRTFRWMQSRGQFFFFFFKGINLRLHLPMQEVQVRSLVGELRFHIPRGQINKLSRSSIVTNLIKTLKMVYIKKKKIKKYLVETRCHACLSSRECPVQDFFCVLHDSKSCSPIYCHSLVLEGLSFASVSDLVRTVTAAIRGSKKSRRVL